MKEQKIKEPMYSKEGMGRLAKWVFGLPLIYVVYMLLALVIPRVSTGLRMTLCLNIVSYVVFLAATAVVVSRFLHFPIRRLLSQSEVFSFRRVLAGFVPMFVLGTGTTFVWMAIRPGDFRFSLQPMWPVDFLLSFVLVVLAALLEEVLCRAYIAYFVSDQMESRPKQKLLYCLASAIVFTIFHFENPEVSGNRAIYAMIFYFFMGFVLMAITLETKGIEAALGIHIANNLVNAWFFTYEDAALKTNAIFTQSNNIGPWTVIQAAFCVGLSALVIMLSERRGTRSGSKR